MNKAFISHSSKDNQFALKIAELLAELGVDVWIDLANIRGGTNWGEEIQQALDDSDVMLLILSPDSMQSQNVRDEWQYYKGHGKRIIPLLYRVTKVPFQLYGLQYVDFISRAFSAAFADLCMALKSHKFRVGSSNKQRPILEADSPYRVQSALTPGRLIYVDDDGVSRDFQPGGGGRSPTLSPLYLRHVAEILPPPFEWIEIRDGELTLHDGRLDQNAAFPLPTFSIARYPITNAQYQAFVDALDGYRNAGWWDYSDSARRWRAANPQPRRATTPGDHPCTHVAWYEAVAFCRWLAFRIGGQQAMVQITLPSVQQWYWAAVADTGYRYPYGERFVRGYCNTRESGLGRTTPVTQYPFGASTYGVMDMCGNAWEWCLNDWVTGLTDIRHEAAQRFVLGGSWHDHHSFASAWHWPARQPGARKSTQGFRLAAAL